MNVIPIQVIQEEVIIPLTYFPRESELELLVRGDVAIVRPKTAAFEPEDTAVAAERDAFSACTRSYGRNILSNMWLFTVANWLTMIRIWGHYSNELMPNTPAHLS